jgi:hypothetical protein
VHERKPDRVVTGLVVILLTVIAAEAITILSTTT